jgi:predicted DNA binding protein
MRAFRIVLSPKSGSFHRLDGLVAEYAGLKREAILHLNLLNDETGVALYHVRGDPVEFQALLEDEPEALSLDVFDSERDGFYAHIHFEPDHPATELMQIIDRHKLIVNPPLAFTEEGDLRLTAAGPQEVVRQAAIDIPDSVDARLELIGEYDPEREGLLTALTDRQQEVLSTAVEMGYYSLPREATHEELAEELDCSAGTVGEHLRKIEAALLSMIAS